MTIGTIQHFNVRLPMPELLRVRDFYRDVLGLVEGPRPPFRFKGFWLYAGDEPVLHLSETREGEEVPLLEQRRSAINHIAFTCTGIEDLRSRLDSNEVEYEVTEVPQRDQTQIFFVDPAGVRVELNFASVPATRLDSQ